MPRPALQAILPLRPLISQAYCCRPNVAGPSRLRLVTFKRRDYAQANAKHANGPDGSDDEGEAIRLASPTPPAGARSGRYPLDDSVGRLTSRQPEAQSTEPSAEPSTSRRDLNLDDRIAKLKTRAAEAYKQANTSASAWSTETRRQAQERFEQLKSEIGRLSWRINEATGYEEIDRLKALVTEREAELQSARDTAKAAKTAYDNAVTARSSAQASVNSLLERKHQWTDADVSTFTSLIRSDHSSTAAVSKTSTELDHAEASVDKAFSALTQAILRRYHEEQVWSDKIRSFSTWASLAGLGINLVVFLTAIVLVEPWKRRKMAEGIERRMGRMMEHVESRIEGLQEQVAASALATTSADTPLAASPQDAESLSTEVADLPLAEEAIIDIVGGATPRTFGHDRAPLLQTVLPDLPPQLAALTPFTTPSHDRDLAIATTLGIALGAILVGTVRLVRGS